MSDINPNTPVTAPVSTETVAGDAPQTFDELEAAIKAKKSPPAEKKEAKETDSKKDEKPKDLTSDDQKGKKEPPKKEAKEKEEKADKEEKPEAPPKRKLKYKAGEQESEIDEDVLFTVKVNGVDTPVTAKDLMENYSGKVAWKERFSDVSRKSKEYESKLNTTNERLKAIFEEKDPEMRMWRMAEFGGINPIQFKKLYLDENMPLLEKWYSMTEDEREAYLLGEENRYLKHQASVSEKRGHDERLKIDLQKRIATLQKDNGVSEDEFIQAYTALEGLVDDQNPGSLIKSKDLTPEKVIETVRKERFYGKAYELVEQFKHGMDDKKLTRFLVDFTDTSFANGLTEDLIQDVFDDMFKGPKKSQKIVSEKLEEREQFMSGKKEVPSSKKADAALFEDLF